MRAADTQVTQAELAEVLGVTTRTLRDLTSSGVLTKSTRRGLYKLGESVKAYVARIRNYQEKDGESPDLSLERARHERAKADHAELRRDRARAELLDRSEVLATWAEVLSRVKQMCLALPNLARVQLRLTDDQYIRLTGIVDDRLRAAADPQVDVLPPVPADEAVEDE